MSDPTPPDSSTVDTVTPLQPIEKALAEGLREHHIRDIDGRCLCGEFVSDGDPERLSRHIATAQAATPPMQEVARLAAIGAAVERLLKHTHDEAGVALLHVPAGSRPDGRTLADEPGWTVERWRTVYDRVNGSGPTIESAIAAALEDAS